MKKIFILISCFLAVSCVSDDNSFYQENSICTQEVRFGLSIAVKDAVTGQILKDGVSVVAKDHAYVETLQATEHSDAFIGAAERSGAYTISIDKSGYGPQTVIVNVSRDYCHVITESRIVLLQPQ